MSVPRPANAFASHLINQTLSSIALLESLNVLNSSDASLIRQKLPSPTGPFPSLAIPSTPHQLNTNASGQIGSSSPTSSFGGLSISQNQPHQQQQSPSWTVRHATDDSIHSNSNAVVVAPQQPAPAPAPSLPPRNRPTEIRAKALWDFNGTEGDDLQFRSGDIIVIDEEVNDQWYRGRVMPQGHTVPLPRSGLFPSNYIEKLPPAPYYSSPPPPQQQPPQMMIPYQGSAQGYYDQKLPQNALQMQPMQNQGQMQMQGMPPHQQVQGGVVVQEQQKGKFGKIGGQLGTAFTTGIGFGAGSAIASEAVHAIF